MENKKFLRKILEMILVRLARENLLTEIDRIDLFKTLDLLFFEIGGYELVIDFDDKVFHIWDGENYDYVKKDHEEITRKTNEFLDLAIDAIRNHNEKQ